MPCAFDFCYSGPPLPDSRFSISIAANSIPIVYEFSGINTKLKDYVEQELSKNIAGVACVWPVWSLSWKYLAVGIDSTTLSPEHVKPFSTSLAAGLGERED